jgi:hypothetical protein
MPASTLTLTKHNAFTTRSQPSQANDVKIQRKVGLSMGEPNGRLTDSESVGLSPRSCIGKCAPHEGSGGIGPGADDAVEVIELRFGDVEPAGRGRRAELDQERP